MITGVPTGAVVNVPVDLRREFDNFGSAARTVCSRWSLGVYRTSKRPSEPCVVDARGQAVRSLEMAHTFLTDAEVDELVAGYEAGATLRGLAKQFHIHRLTVAAHLARSAGTTRHCTSLGVEAVARCASQADQRCRRRHPVIV